MNRAKILFIPILIAVFIGTSALADKDKDESGKGKNGNEWSEKYKEKDDRDYNDKDKYERDKDRERWSERYGKKDREMYFHRHGYERLNIPKGHYPPPGECRIWYPDRPAGQQPPPTGCRNIPPGAWAIRHPAHNPGHVYVDVFDPYRPGSVYVTGEFDLGSGAFIRVILGR